MGKENIALSMYEIQSVSLNVLKVIADICHENGWRYTLAFGTLIGAIRHKGFIPWDDDIDILMPRKDYEQLLKYFSENRIPHIQALNYRNNKRFMHGITRVCDTRYRVIEKSYEEYGLGIFVDIYPMDGLGNTIEEARVTYATAIGMADVVVDVSRRDRHIWQDVKPWKSRIKQWLLYRYRCLWGYQYYLKQLEQYARSRPFDNYKYVGNSNWTWLPLCFERDWFNHLIKVPFEDAEFYIVEKYDAMLRMQYGDYMQLPPEENRVYHHCYIAYKK